MKRRCGFLPAEAVGPPRLVWARGNVALETCPKAYISAESELLVEEFFVRRRFRVFDVERLSARQVEAFMILEKELETELRARRAVDF